MKKPTSQLQLRVVESAVRVVKADELLGDVGREGAAPNHRSRGAIAATDRLLVAVQYSVASQTVGCSGMWEPNTTGP
eukprot:scaffold23366_cov215-Cylindrotheca_fusiformis.AAC.3